MKTTLPLLCLTLLAAPAAPAAMAQGLSFDVLPPYEPSPGTFVYDGPVTNGTGVVLQSTDLFFDFTGFDPSAVAVSQLLGTTAFPVADGTTSAVTGLFEATLSPGVSAQDYPVVAQLQDANGDLSDPVTVVVHAASVPEPGTPALFAAGFIVAAPLAFRSRRRRDAGPRRLTKGE